jgi:hypothetical protein
MSAKPAHLFVMFTHYSHARVVGFIGWLLYQAFVRFFACNIPSPAADSEAFDANPDDAE